MRMDIGMAADDTTNAALRAPTAAERAQQFERDGYIVARQMFSHGEMRDFIAECQSYEGKNAHRVEPNSAGSMQFYSEIYRRSELVRRFVSQRTLIDFLVPITGPDLWVRWDQAVAKGPASGVFDWHTDTGYDLLPQPHFEVWIALSENRENNGGLCVIPGSHRGRRHSHRRVGKHVVAVESERYDAADSGKVFIDANEGDVVVFSSLLLHKTYENTTDKSRWAYVAEVMKLGDFDPTTKAPYFVIARDGQPVGALEPRLACASDPAQIVKTLPLAIRHHLAGPLIRSIRAAFTPAAPG